MDCTGSSRATLLAANRIIQKTFEIFVFSHLGLVESRPSPRSKKQLLRHAGERVKKHQNGNKCVEFIFEA